MRIKTEELCGSGPLETIIRIYETNLQTDEDEIVCDVILSENAEPIVSLQYSDVWPQPEPLRENWTFSIEGFGTVGYANLAAFVPHTGYKPIEKLAVGESTVGKLQKVGSDKKPERITRLS